MGECIKNTTKNVYKAEEVEKGKIENSQRPMKSGPLLPLQICGTSCPLPWKQRNEKGGGDQYDHIYMETKQWNQRGLAPLMLMPRGVVVWRRLIHFDSRARRCYWLVLPGLSTAIMVMSFLECPGKFKCLATGISFCFSHRHNVLEGVVWGSFWFHPHIAGCTFRKWWHIWYWLTNSWVNGGWWSFPQ